MPTALYSGAKDTRHSTEQYKGYTLQARETVFYPSTESVFILHIFDGDDKSLGQSDIQFPTVEDAKHYGRNWVDGHNTGRESKPLEQIDDNVILWLENLT